MLKKQRKRFIYRNLLYFFIGQPIYKKKQISIEMMNFCYF